MQKTLERIYNQVVSLNYKHIEGGKYSYVKFLSITREIPECFFASCPAARQTIALIRHNFNEMLCHSFSVAQERFFEVSRKRVARLLLDVMREAAPAGASGLMPGEGAIQETASSLLQAKT